MAGATERVAIAQPPAAWPNPARIEPDASASQPKERLNTHFRRTLVYLLARSRGGHNRCRILKLLQEDGPLNANQIAGALGLLWRPLLPHVPNGTECGIPR